MEKPCTCMLDLKMTIINKSDKNGVNFTLTFYYRFS